MATKKTQPPKSPPRQFANPWPIPNKLLKYSGDDANAKRICYNLRIDKFNYFKGVAPNSAFERINLLLLEALERACLAQGFKDFSDAKAFEKLVANCKIVEESN